MNWGHKLTIVIAAFIIIMLGMVYIAFRQTNEMMDEGYYAKELKYQSYIDASKNLNSVSTEAILSQQAEGIVVRIPESLIAGFANGKIEFLRNDNEKKDLLVNVTPDATGIFIIDQSKFSLGKYIARIQWESKGKPYYREETLILDK